MSNDYEQATAAPGELRQLPDPVITKVAYGMNAEAWRAIEHALVHAATCYVNRDQSLPYAATLYQVRELLAALDA